MLIVDLNQVLFSNFFASVGRHTNIEIEENLLRHMVLNVIRSINVKFRKDYGKMIIANDNIKYWRKEFFPFYKASRKKSRDASDLDWTAIFECLGNIKSDLKEYFPYKFMEVDGAEADDIIGAICMEVRDENILIVSGDKDFQQLQVFSNVKQFDPINKRWIKCNDPKGFLKDHILKGDRGDGIPNILSPDNCFVMNENQKRLTTKRIQRLQTITEDMPEYRNYIRNQTLIDLTCMPDELRHKIVEEYYKETNTDRSKLLPYFMKHRLNNLMESLSEF